MIRAAIIAGLALTAPGLFGQDASFEVASIKPNRTALGAGIGNRFTADRMSWTNVPLSALLTEVYGVKAYQIADAPRWLDVDTWDIEAKSEGPTTGKQKYEMLKVLLADRFALKFHWETREFPGYRLVVSKTGNLKMKPVTITEEDVRLHRAGNTIRKGLLSGYGTTLPHLANFLAGELGRPVVDATGLTGTYEFKLEWLPDETQPNSGGESPPPDAVGPTIVMAVQDQLGLKLESGKVPVEVLVIDHVAKVTGN